jgi:mannose-1-phosphate guanylyltransferase
MSDPFQDVFVVILAGGSGTRFWPKSRHHTPKQLCKIGSPTATLVEETLDRLEGWIPPTRRLLVTHHQQLAQTQKICGDRVGLYLPEPQARNTACALAFAALEIQKTHPNAVMVSLHADHVIQNQQAFRDTVIAAISVARKGFLTLLGVVPHYPETGYGYIEKGTLLDPTVLDAFHVKSFREKPSREIATEYVESKGFLWNSGIFVWQVNTFLQEIATYTPEVYEPLHGNTTHFHSTPWSQWVETYHRLPSISVDHGVLEKSQRIAVVPARFDWLDVGSWGAMTRVTPGDAEGNLAYGDHWLLDCHNTTVDTDGPFVAAVGVEDLVIVVSQGAVLVCRKDRDQDVKQIVTYLQAEGRKDLL